MARRPKILNKSMYADLIVEIPDGSQYTILKIQVLCPECSSDQVGTNGTQERKNGRVINYQCKNNKCISLKRQKYNRQFVITESLGYRKAISNILQDLSIQIMEGNTSQSAVAKNFHVSPSLITYIRAKIEN